MDIYPLLCIPVAYLLAEITRWRGLRVLVRLTVLGLLVLNLVWQVSLLAQEGPIPVVLGLERVEDYLAEHGDPPYKAIHFINQLPSDSLVFFVGNGQSYYVTVDHVVDVNHDNWGHLIYLRGKEPAQLHRALMTQGVTHVYYSGYDFVWQQNFDYNGHLTQELALFDLFAARCGRMIYDDGENGQVFALLEQCTD
jgi:hypothetical protein